MEKNMTLGTYLQNAREAKNISLRDIADRTKININILRALEENDIDKLPNRTYVRGFVQNYAKIVSLPMDETNELLGRLYNPTDAQVQVQEVRSEADEITDEVLKENSTIQPSTNPSEQGGNNINLDLNIQDKMVTLMDIVTNKRYLAMGGSTILAILVIKGLFGFFQQLSNEKIAMKSQQIIQEKPVLKKK
jgi:transcriptional regulator with XRE-family HTH domain